MSFQGPVGDRLFITGGTGFLGAHLRTELANRGVEVTVFAQPDATVDLHDSESIQRGDITDEESVNIAGHDTVVHLAAQTQVDAAISDPRTTWNINATGTLNVLEAARHADISTLLYTSSSSVYGPPESLPVTERHPLKPSGPYGASKLAGDRLVNAYHLTYGVPTVIARPFNTYGPGQASANVIPTIIQQALEVGRVELGNLSPSRDFLYVDDAVTALLTLLTDGNRGEVYNVGRGEAIEIGELASMVIDQIDESIPIESVADRRRDESVEIERHVADPSKLRALGWIPEYDLEEGLERTVEAFRSRLDGGFGMANSTE